MTSVASSNGAVHWRSIFDSTFSSVIPHNLYSNVWRHVNRHWTVYLSKKLCAAGFRMRSYTTAFRCLCLVWLETIFSTSSYQVPSKYLATWLLRCPFVTSVDEYRCALLCWSAESHCWSQWPFQRVSSLCDQSCGPWLAIRLAVGLRNHRRTVGIAVGRSSYLMFAQNIACT